MEPQKLISRKHINSSTENKEDIEAEWTKLLLDWNRICGQVRTSLDEVDFVDLLRTYGDVSDMEVQCEPLRDLDPFLERKFPKLEMSSKEDVSRKPYITATVLLYHCIISGPVNVVINICLYLSLKQQIMVKRFCEELRDKDITVTNIDAAIAGIFINSSEIYDNCEQQTVEAGLWSALHNASKGSLTETSTTVNISSITTIEDMANAKDKTEIACNSQNADLQPETSSTTYVIDTSRSESFDCRYSDETRIDTINVTDESINLIDKEKERCSTRVSKESLKIESKMNSGTTVDTQNVYAIEGYNDDAKSCYIIKQTLDKNDSEQKNVHVNQARTVNPQHLDSINSFDYLNKKASKIRHSKSESYDRLHSPEKDAWKTRKSKSMAFYSRESFDPTTEPKRTGGINMLYLNSSFLEKSSVFVYPEQPTYKVTVIDTTASEISKLKVISKQEIENITPKTSDSLTEPEKPLTNNSTVILDTAVLETEVTSKSVIEGPSNIKTPSFQNPRSCLSTDEINNVENESIREEITFNNKDEPCSLNKFKRPKFIEIAKVHDTPSAALDEAVDALLDAVDTVYFKSLCTGKSSFSGYCIRIWSEVKRKVSSMVLLRKKSVIESKGDLSTFEDCAQENSKKDIKDLNQSTSEAIIKFVDKRDPPSTIHPPNTHTETEQKSKGSDDSDTSIDKDNSVSKRLRMNILKDAVKKREMTEQESKHGVEGDIEYRCSNYIDNFESKSDQKQKRHVFFSRTTTEPQPTREPRRFGCRINPADSLASTKSVKDELVLSKASYGYKIIYGSICAIVTILSLFIILLIVLFATRRSTRENANDLIDVNGVSRRHNLLNEEEKFRIVQHVKMNPSFKWPCWECSNGVCQKADQTEIGCYESLSRCTLLCSGPQLWPISTGYTYFSNEIVALRKNKLRYKYNNPSQRIIKYLDEAIYLFQRNLARLEVTESMETVPLDLVLRDVSIEIDIEGDLDPNLRLATNESYSLIVKTADEVKVEIKSASFHGMRYGLETLSQLILLDQSTGYLITLTNVTIKDAPAFKYRGLMIDTSKNYIPLTDILRTIDAMSMCKLNTLHWRISEVTFPILISKFPELFENNVMKIEMMYSTDDVKAVVKNAGFRGIRVLIEVASPVPLTSNISLAPNASKEKGPISDALCLKMKASDSIFNVLETFYSFIINLTKVEDIFHLSNSLLVFIECFDLLEERERFLERAQAHLASANRGNVPKLPIIWYSANITSLLGWMWYDFGVQLYEEKFPDAELDKYKFIASGPWDLSCKVMDKQKCVKYRTWQQMYEWKKRNLETLLEGGEALLWMDNMVDTNNLDALLWPRLAAVAEQLWADSLAHESASDHLRLEAHRWRMLLRGVEVQPTRPSWCDDPKQCSNINT